MPQISYLKRRGSTYYAQIAVPLDLQDIVGAKMKERSLRTKDPRDAKWLVLSMVQEWNAQFDELRARRALTTDDKGDAVWRHYSDTLSRDEIVRQHMPTAAEIEAATGDALDRMVMKSGRAFDAYSRRIKLDSLRRHLAEGETALINHEVDAYLEGNGLVVARGSKERLDLARRMMRAEIEALERTIERDRGDYAGIPKDPIVKPASGSSRERAAPGEGIMELFDRYARENAKGISTDTLTQARRDVQLFAETVGNIPAGKVEKKAVREWKALLLDYPVKAAEITAFRGMTMRQVIKANEKIGKPAISDRTVNRYLSALGAFCDWLVRNDYLDRNPVEGLYQSIDKTKRRKDAFSVERMKKLFASPLFTGSASDEDWQRPGDTLIRDHRYWIPLIMLYGGARPGEIAQLLVDDVRQLHGQWIMHVTTNDDDDKRVKTKGSMRVVPVHSELVRLGFIQYHERMMVAAETRLFPLATRNQRGQMVADFSRDFGRYLGKLGIKEGRRLSLYSFRHGFIDALRRAEYLDAQFGFLVGHAEHTTTGQYGQLPQGMLRQRVEMIEAVIYPGLDLTQLYPV